MTSAPIHQRRNIAKALSRAANASVADMLQTLQGSAGACRRIGVTGPPGAGKSSLIASLARQRLRRVGDIAILAIDPTSPVSGGAILGDRIRMEELAHNSRIYIRSLASRRSLDGLADNLPDMLEILENAGFAELILETVGVGQVEYAVRDVVDTTLLVLMPGAGDHIQAMKSGILETADILVVNKSDQPGANQLVTELGAVLRMRNDTKRSWTPPIVATSSGDPSSVDALGAAIDRHQAWLIETKSPGGVLEARTAHHVRSLVARRVNEILDELPAEALRAPVATLYETLTRRLAEYPQGAQPQARPPL